MPIDSEVKRRSVIGIRPIPDGAINALDRRQLLGLYRIATSAPVAEVKEFEEVPVKDQEPWWFEATAILELLIECYDGAATLVGEVAFPVDSFVDTTLADDATLGITHAVHRVMGDTTAVTLNTTTPMDDGGVDGQLLTLIGSSDSMTVTIEDSGNVWVNGPITLTDGDVLRLQWDATFSLWVEAYRNS